MLDQSRRLRILILSFWENGSDLFSQNGTAESVVVDGVLEKQFGGIHTGEAAESIAYTGCDQTAAFLFHLGLVGYHHSIRFTCLRVYKRISKAT